MNDFNDNNNQYNPYGAPQNNNPQYDSQPYGAPASNDPQYGSQPYGAPVNNDPQYGSQPYGAPVNSYPQYGYPQTPVSKEEFFETQASTFKKDLKSSLIVCYICIAATAVVSIAFGAFWGLIDAGLLLAVTLGLQFKKKKGFAIALLALAIFEVVMAVIAGSVAGYMWVAAGISALHAFSKAEKEYKAYLAGFGITPQQ